MAIVGNSDRWEEETSNRSMKIELRDVNRNYNNLKQRQTNLLCPRVEQDSRCPASLVSVQVLVTRNKYRLC